MYEIKKYDYLLGMEGFSDELLKNHFTLYEGYVANTNKTLELLKTLKLGTSEHVEVKRRFGWEWNGMRLHEYYFENMKKDSAELDESSVFAEKIIKDFGTVEEWKKDFQATGAMRGIGWVICAYDKERDVLFNTWINEHDVGHLAGAQPILIMDVFEHAFMIDYGLKRAEYIDSFWNNIDWEVVNNRIN